MIDGHIHYAGSLGADRLNKVLREGRMEGAALLCIPKGGRLPVETDAFVFKRQSKIPVYVFGGIDRRIYDLPREDMAGALQSEVHRLMEMGCTGVKMLEGKPNVRKAHPIPDFDCEVWEPYWKYMEDSQIPVYMHVNDPEEFWDADKVSEYAKKAGWYYDRTYVNNEDQYRQMSRVLERHPGLRILFPHFFFLSRQLKRLAHIFDCCPNVYTDMAPGIELYKNLSENIGEARDFFGRYQDRICFGTDIGARSLVCQEDVPLSLEESRARIGLVTAFLDAQEDYVLYPDGYYYREGGAVTIHSLNLTPEIREKIYRTNFRRFALAGEEI